MLNPTKGNAGEAAVLNSLVQRGFDALLPFGAGHPYDLAVDLGRGAFLRVQCKTAWPSRGCMLFNTRTTDHGRGPQSYVGIADVFGVYFPPLESIYLVPIEAVGSHEGRLRLEPTRNGQKRRVRFAAEYEIQRWSVESLRALVTADVPIAQPTYCTCHHSDAIVPTQP
jgi:hypothetical protein